MTAQELDLQVVKRVHVREAVADRTAQELIVREELVLLLDRQQMLLGTLEFAANGRKYFLAQLRVRD